MVVGVGDSGIYFARQLCVQGVWQPVQKLLEGGMRSPSCCRKEGKCSLALLGHCGVLSAPSSPPSVQGWVQKLSHLFPIAADAV